MNDNEPRQADNDMIDSPTPSHSGTTGGAMQRDVGARDEDKTATGADPQPTSVHKSDKADEGDEPNLPNREGYAANDRAPPRRT